MSKRLCPGYLLSTAGLVSLSPTGEIVWHLVALEVEYEQVRSVLGGRKKHGRQP